MDEVPEKISHKKHNPHTTPPKIHLDDNESDGLYQSIKFESFEELSKIEDYIEKEKRIRESADDLNDASTAQMNQDRMKNLELKLDKIEKMLVTLLNKVRDLEQMINK